MLALKSNQIAALTSDQLLAIQTGQFAALTTDQVAGLTSDQIVVLSTDQVVALTTAQVVGLRTAQIAALTTDQILALETQDLAALTSSQIVALRTEQVIALTTAEIASLTTDQVPALSTQQFVALTTLQIEALTSVQVMSLTGEQFAAITTDQISHLTFASPLILDLTGNGISTQSAGQGVKFDLFTTGQQVGTGWVAGGDGFLVLDRNHDGAIDSGAELFGNGTTLADGTRAANGYVALQELDANADGVINASDQQFKDLQVWIDSNADGISQATELQSLSSLGIVELGLSPQTASTVDHGNVVGLTSAYVTQDGSSHAMADVWFQLAGTVPATAGVAADQARSDPPAAGAKPTLQSRVSQLVTILNSGVASSLGATGGTQEGVNGDSMARGGPMHSGLLAAAEAFRQFDANGRAVSATPFQGAAPALDPLTRPLGGKPDGGVLASGK
jgi:hypothetical protein